MLVNQRFKAMAKEIMYHFQVQRKSHLNEYQNNQLEISNLYLSENNYVVLFFCLSVNEFSLDDVEFSLDDVEVMTDNDLAL